MRALYDWVIVETVGVGQSETEIADFADLVVFCAQPGSGDALQFMKAGIMEMPDIVLVTKGDMGAVARRAAADVKGALSLAAGDGRPAQVAIVSAQTGAGIDDALDAIGAHAAAAKRDDLADLRRAQAVAWAESRLTESFGRVGRAALAARVSRLRTPFGVVSQLLRDAQPLVHESLKNI
jgi:LAO/AO transport system kinase